MDTAKETTTNRLSQGALLPYLQDVGRPLHDTNVELQTIHLTFVDGCPFGIGPPCSFLGSMLICRGVVIDSRQSLEVEKVRADVTCTTSCISQACAPVMDIHLGCARSIP